MLGWGGADKNGKYIFLFIPPHAFYFAALPLVQSIISDGSKLYYLSVFRLRKS